MSVALIIVVVFGISSVGGVVEVMNHATSMPGYFSLTHTFDVLKQQTGDYGPLTIFSTLAWGLGYFGMPHIIVRFMSIEKASMVKKSATVAIIWVILSLGSVCLIAYFGRMLVAEELLANGMQKTIFITLARRLFPAFIAGVLLAAIIWFLKIYDGGKYCTFPHAIELLNKPYEELFTVLMTHEELENYLSPFVDAWKGGAAEQLMGQIASAKIPLSRMISPQLYWVMSGNDFTLDILSLIHI